MVVPEDWMCMKVRWLSPVGVGVASGKWCGKKGIMLCSVGSPASLLKLAAAEGFWAIPKAGLRKLAKEFELDVDGTAPLHQMVLSMAEQVLGVLSDEKQLEILRKRLPKGSDLQDLLQEEGLDELLDEADKKAFEDAKKESAAVEAEVGPAVRKLAQKIQSKPTVGGSGKGRSRGESSGSTAKRRKRFPDNIDIISEDSTVAVLQTFLPPQCKFGVDLIDSYWRMTNCDGIRHGRSWKLHGRKESALQLLALGWERALQYGFETVCPYPSLVKRFSARAASSSSAAE
eukprot:3778750-Amphidinium_carterae.5